MKVNDTIEIPASLEKPLADTQKKRHDAVDEDRKEILRHEEEEIQKLSSWLWFEFTPYEVGCDRLGGVYDLLASRGFNLLSLIAWIPSWALGRRFEKGRSIDRSVCEEIVSFWSIALNNMNLF